MSRALRLATGLAALTLAGCDAVSPSASYATDFLSRMAEPVQSAVATSPYAKVIGPCTFERGLKDSCALSTLPFLGQETNTATIDQIMQRVVVSHPWMATRFRQVLESQPTALLQMFRSTTAVIIGSKVRPSFYYPLTGAIYLDPEDLWLTQAERATINMDPDFRSGFGSELQFRAIWRYVKDNDYAYPFYPDDFTGSRSIDDIRIPLGRLLAHELAHAGDFAPPAGLATLSREQTAVEAINAQSGQWISDRLTGSKPLTSATWLNLAQVLYANKTPTAVEKGYTPAQAGELLANDRAADAYGYFTQFEDLAMITEEILSWCFYGIQRDFATSNRPNGGDFVVGWGVRGRIAEPQVEDAARFVTGELLPGVSLESCYASLPEPVMMRSGATWTDNLDPSGSGASAKSGSLTRPGDSLPPGVAVQP